MNSIGAGLFRLILLGGMVVWVLTPGYGHTRSMEDIFTWTMAQMKIVRSIDQPAVRWVSRSELKRVFEENNRNAFLKWESQYGSAEAQKIMHIYLDEIVGLFVTHGDVIYVGAFLDPCRRQAILAHEFVHYLQEATRGLVVGDDEGAENLRWLRENEAYSIEARFMRDFCEPHAATIARAPD